MLARGPRFFPDNPFAVLGVSIDADRPALAVLEGRAARMKAMLAHSSDGEARRSASEEAMHILQDLARLRDLPANVKAVLLAEIETFEDHVADMAENLDPDVIRQIQELGRSAREALSLQDWNKAKQVLEHMKTVFHRELWRQPAFVAALFDALAAERYAALDKGLHDTLVAQGQRARSADNTEALRQVVGQLFGNRRPGELASSKAVQLASLVR